MWNNGNSSYSLDIEIMNVILTLWKYCLVIFFIRMKLSTKIVLPYAVVLISRRMKRTKGNNFFIEKKKQFEVQRTPAVRRWRYTFGTDSLITSQKWLSAAILVLLCNSRWLHVNRKPLTPYILHDKLFDLHKALLLLNKYRTDTLKMLINRGHDLLQE